ncbi:hypothetical protein BLAT2472_50056 [Burkholderia latens]
MCFPHFFICAVLRRAIPPRERAPGLRAARRIQFTHADTQSKALSGSLFESFGHFAGVVSYGSTAADLVLKT